MAKIRLRLIGAFEATGIDGQGIRLPAGKPRALLAYLAFEEKRPTSREKLAELLWSERPQGRGRHSLNQALTTLRQRVGPIFAVDGDAISLDLDRVDVDVLRLRALAECQSLEALQEAAGIACGDFLLECNIKEREFEDWLATARREVSEIAVAVHIRVLQQLEPEPDRSNIAAVAKRLLKIDPACETAHRVLIETYRDLDRPELAIRQYEICRAQLHQHLGVAPDTDTEALVRSIGDVTTRETRSDIKLPSALGRKERTPFPTVMVMPIGFIGSDDTSEYLANALTHDLSLELGRYRSLNVIGSHTSLALRGRDTDFLKVCHDFEVDYALTGSLLRRDSRACLKIQLIDGSTGIQHWNECYDFDLPDLFDVNADVLGAVTGTVPIVIEQDRRLRTRRKPTKSWDAYDHFIMGLEAYYWKWNGFDCVERAKPHFEKAIELDPEFARPYAWLGCLSSNYFAWFADGVEGEVEQCLNFPRRALAVDPQEPDGHRVLSAMYVTKRRFDEGLYHLTRGLRLNPNYADFYAHYGRFFAHYGEPERALRFIRRAMRINPIHPDWYWEQIGVALHTLCRYRDAAAAFHKINRPAFYEHMYLAACYAEMDDVKRAGRHADLVLADRPDLTLSIVARHLPYRRTEDRQHVLRGLKAAGMPA